MNTPSGHDGNTTILGVDTSLRSTGVGVVAGPARGPMFITCGIIKTPAKEPHTECLRRLDAGITELIEEHRPDAVAIEGAFFAKNAKTAMILGQARGVVLAAAARAGIPVYEYAPRAAKLAVTGYGNASKEQMGKMVATMLKLKKVPQEDAADALGLAICHLQRSSGVRAEPLKPI